MNTTLPSLPLLPREDGWLQIAPAGDYPQSGGGQLRLDAHAGDAIVAAFLAEKATSDSPGLRVAFDVAPLAEGSFESPTGVIAELVWVDDETANSTHFKSAQLAPGLWARVSWNDGAATLVMSGRPLEIAALATNEEADSWMEEHGGAPIFYTRPLRIEGLVVTDKLHAATADADQEREWNLVAPAAGAPAPFAQSSDYRALLLNALGVDAQSSAQQIAEILANTTPIVAPAPAPLPVVPAIPAPAVTPSPQLSPVFTKVTNLLQKYETAVAEVDAVKQQLQQVGSETLNILSFLPALFGKPIATQEKTSMRAAISLPPEPAKKVGEEKANNLANPVTPPTHAVTETAPASASAPSIPAPSIPAPSLSPSTGAPPPAFHVIPPFRRPLHQRSVSLPRYVPSPLAKSMSGANPGSEEEARARRIANRARELQASLRIDHAQAWALACGEVGA